MGKIFNSGLFTQSSGGGGGTGAVDSVNGKTGTVVLTKADIGLGNVDNTSDANKPVSTAVQAELDTLDGKIGANKDDITALQTDVTNINTSLDSLDEKVGTLQTDLGDLGNQVVDVQNKVNTKFDKDNLVGGNSIAINEVLPEGGIDEHTLACWHFDDSSLDEVSNNNFSSINTINKSFFKFGEGSSQLNSATTGNITINSNSACVDFWTRSKTSSTNSKINVSLSCPVIGNGGFIHGWQVQFRENTISFGYGTSAGLQYIETKSVAYDTDSKNDFVHFAVCRTDLEHYYIFVNGRNVMEAQPDSSKYPVALGHFAIYPANNYIDELRISDVVRYTSDFFRVPTKAYTTATGPSTYKIDYTGTASASDSYGIKGDYATHYGIINCQGGLITTTVGSKSVTVKAGIQLLMPGEDIKTQIGTDIVYPIQSDTNVTLFLADGKILEAGDVFYQVSEPNNGQHNYAAWYNPEVNVWKFKSNDTGNVWREAKATPIADVYLNTDGTGVTRIDYVGYRVLNDTIFQEKLTAGDNITISEDNVISATGGSVPTNMVTTDTEQTISGEKTHTGSINLSDNAYIKFKNTPFIIGDDTANTLKFGNSNYTNMLYSHTEVQVMRDVTSEDGMTVTTQFTNIDSGNISEHIAKASTTTSGVITIATDEDVTTGTDTTKCVTCAQVKSVAGEITGSIIPTLNEKASSVDVQNALDQKQDKLTAGTNITIVDNVISSTGGSSGTTPENMVTTDTEQTITGVKTFEQPINVGSSSSEYVNFSKSELSRVSSTGVVQKVFSYSYNNAGIGDPMFEDYKITLNTGTSPIVVNRLGTETKVVESQEITKIKKLTQAEYNALTTKDENTFYAIVG